MYYGSDEFNSIIDSTQGSNVSVRLKFAEDEILETMSICKFYGGSNDTDDITVGTTMTQYVDATVFTDKLLGNREFLLEASVKLSDGTYEYAPIGYFTVKSPKGDNDEVSFVAYDRMIKFEKVYSSALTYPTDSEVILNELCALCGVELATTIDTPITITENLQGYTCREVLGYIAGIHGYFACFDRFGKLNLRWYEENAIEKTLKYIWSFDKSQDLHTIGKVEVAKNSETTYTSGDGITTLHHSNPYATQEIVDGLFAKLNGYSYNSGEIDMLDDIRLDPWDVVKVEYYDNVVYHFPLMSIQHDFGASNTVIKAFAKDVESEYRFTGPTIKYLNRVASDMLIANRVLATKVDAEYVNSIAITTENFEAKVAEIKDLVVDEIDGRYAEIDLANIDIANINVGKIGELFAKVGLIDRATIKDGHITGFLDAVEINANKITAGTLIADRILLSGGNKGVLYALNNLGELTSTNVNSLDGYVLTDRTITADKIIAKSITTNELDVNQIFGNTAVLNTIVSQDIFAQAIATNSLVVGAYGVAEEALNTINGLEIGGTNLLPDTNVNTLSAVAGDVSRYWSDSSRTDITCEFFELTDAPVSGLKYGVRQSNTVTGNYGRNLTWRATEKIEMEDGEEYTLSCYARITSGTKARLRFRFYNTGNQQYHIEIDNTEWKRVSYTIKVDKSIWENDYCNIGCGGLVSTYVATVELCGFKLEKGNRATDWTPAPEDVDYNVETANSNANTAISTSNTANTNATNALNRATYHYGTCSTAAGTAAKVVTLSGFVLYTGAQVTVQFSKANTAANPTLNVNSTGAKNIRVNNANISAKYYWKANNTVTFVYNGTYWVMSDTSANTIIANWCSSNDVTYIDGGKIYTGSITADKIDVNDLFAQDITATGSITGATLVSIKDEDAKIVIDKGGITIYDFDTRGEGGFYEIGSLHNAAHAVGASGAWIFESLSTELGNDVDEMAERLNKITQRKFILIGDSYLAGQTPDGDIDSWGVYLKKLLPEYSFSIHAIKGSGFGSTVSGKNFLDALKRYTGDKDVITDIIVCGGYNDAATSITTSAVLTGIANFISYVNQNFPNAKIHIGYVGASNNGIVLEQIKEAIRIYRACGSKGCGYISNMEYTIRNTQFFTSDGVHPNQIGQKNIAWNIASYLTTGNVSVIQEKENCNVVSPSTVTAGITLYTALNNDISSLYHPKTEQLTFTGLSATKMNGAEGSRITLGTLTNSSIIGNQTTSSVATSTANASVSVPINIKTSSGWHTGIGTLEIISLNVLLRVNVLNGNNYLEEIVTNIIIPPFTATFDSLDV